MIGTLDLLDHPYAFSQLPLATAQHFRSTALDRGVPLDEPLLSELHRLRLLVPFYRVRRDGRAVMAAYRRSEHEGYAEARIITSTAPDLVVLRNTRRLTDPAGEGFASRNRLRRGTGDQRYNSSYYLYSPHQVIALASIRRILGELRWERRGDDRRLHLDVSPLARRIYRERAQRERELAIVSTRLEPVYYSRIVQRLRLPATGDFQRFADWRRELEPMKILDWLDEDAAWTRAAAQELLTAADRVDPLGAFAEVVARADSDRWRTLKGPARQAIDLRIRAELLLRLYDDLVATGQAESLPPNDPPLRGPFDGRLRPRRGLNALLTDFGLSPHPRMIFVVEGDTELALVPRVMDKLGVQPGEDFIAVQNAAGVDRDLEPLVAYAISPHVRVDEGQAMLRLTRPATRLYVVFDSENTAATEADRDQRRASLLDRMMRGLAPEHQTQTVREQLMQLIEIVTWNRGESFEFAHFTDRELAGAIDRLDQRSRRPQLDRRLELVAQCRQRQGNLDMLLHGVSKPKLAEALWPTLEHKIERALAHGTDNRIPFVRTIVRAEALAREFPRRNLGITL